MNSIMGIAYQTHIGNIRTVNEDRYIVLEDMDGYTLGVVADGMGGHQAGDIASQMAVELILEQLQPLRGDMTIESTKDAVGEAIEKANAEIYRLASQRESYHGMGTTVVVVLAKPDHLVIGHIGDSRAYLVQDNDLTQLTEDHSLVNELVRTGQITEEEANTHPRRNVLTRALGTEPTIETDVNEFAWNDGDYVLLCTDGLSNLVDHGTLLQIIHTNESLDSKVQSLVDRALEAGGDDNITAVLISNERDDQEEKG